MPRLLSMTQDMGMRLSTTLHTCGVVHAGTIVSHTRRFYASLQSCLLVGLLACSSDLVTVPNVGDQVFKQLRLDKRAVVLSTVAPYNTVQLSVTAYRGNGTVIEDVTPTFRASDETLTVTDDGLVTILEPSTQSYVLAVAQYGGVTHTDTTFIYADTVTSPVPLRTFSIDLDESTPVVPFGSSSLIVTATDTNGALIDPSTLVIDYQSADAEIAKVTRQGVVTGVTPERDVVIRATTTVYGVTMTDSVIVSVGYPMFATFFLLPQITTAGDTILVFSPGAIYIARGGTIAFINGRNEPNLVLNTIPIDVVFDNPDVAQPVPSSPYPTGSGNIAPIVASGPFDFFSAIQSRAFFVPGTYTFRSALYGTTGKIHVQ